MQPAGEQSEGEVDLGGNAAWYSGPALLPAIFILSHSAEWTV